MVDITSSISFGRNTWYRAHAKRYCDGKNMARSWLSCCCLPRDPSYLERRGVVWSYGDFSSKNLGSDVFSGLSLLTKLNWYSKINFPYWKDGLRKSVSGHFALLDLAESGIDNIFNRNLDSWDGNWDERKKGADDQRKNKFHDRLKIIFKDHSHHSNMGDDRNWCLSNAYQRSRKYIRCRYYGRSLFFEIQWPLSF